MSFSDMESPPSVSTQSEVPPLSEDSGLLISSGSFSSDSASGWHHTTSELQESDCDEKSLSYTESMDGSGGMCGDNFNTVKKGKILITTIEPPPQFQDNPVTLTVTNSISINIHNGNSIEESKENIKFVSLEFPRNISPLYARKLKSESIYERRPCFSPRLVQLSPCGGGGGGGGGGARPVSRGSLTSRRSSSHNSLTSQLQADDSSFITQAISHDALSARTHDIADMYNVPFDSDIYAQPVDTLQRDHYLRSRGKKPQKSGKKKKSTSFDEKSELEKNYKCRDSIVLRHKELKTKRHSLQCYGSRITPADSDSDSLHMTLREMRRYLHTLYSSSSDSETKNTIMRKNTTFNKIEVHDKYGNNKGIVLKENIETDNGKNIENNNNLKNSSKHFQSAGKSKKEKDVLLQDNLEECNAEKIKKSNQSRKSKMSPVRFLSLNLKASFCNLFRWRRHGGGGGGDADDSLARGESEHVVGAGGAPARRALPPLPTPPPPLLQTNDRRQEDDIITDFATSIHKVKDYGWYWGPISVEAAEKILSNEPDGSFIVRDSSDDHYIFTLTFKLNGLRHVRIEHDQGNFCFGGCTMFKAATIVEFIENAVETSRSGRYLFFLNLRPVVGPVRVQLLYPVSRFKRVQSLQHMCRFVILKYVRRDLVSRLPLPRRLLDYLSATHYYSELLSDL